jgi:hypothetical protein
MQPRSGILVFLFLVAAMSLLGGTKSVLAADEKQEVEILFSDGHRQSIPTADIDHIEFKPEPAVVFKDGHRQNQILRIQFSSAHGESSFGRNYFVGKWEVGVAPGQGKFFITLEADGQARKSFGASHGTWVFVDGEARISWDDGWHDVIRKVGSKHEKFAYAPGRSISDSPSNVTDAKNLTAQPI